MTTAQLRPGMPEWERAWQLLAAAPINRGLAEPTVAEFDGQTWQYMGSDQFRHTFRHRVHPNGYERVYVHIPRSNVQARHALCDELAGQYAHADGRTEYDD